MAETPARIAYSVKEVAASMGVSQWTVREGIRCGRIDYIRMGTRILIPRPVLERLVGRVDQGGEASDAASETGT
jgi:excisionase family DNA binding protein